MCPVLSSTPPILQTALFEFKEILLFAEYEKIFYEPLKKALLQGNLLFNHRHDIIIKLAKLKNDAGIIGATLI